MRRSFRRLVLSSVLISWAVGFAVLYLYAWAQSWTEEEARADGVFLIYELLDEMPAPDRAEHLAELRQHTTITLSLMTLDEVESRVGRPVRPGALIRQRYPTIKEGYLLVFSDGRGALEAGPVNPARPTGTFPIGIVLTIITAPLIVGFVALRMERALAKVELTSQAIAGGELGARVADRRGTAGELAERFDAMAERVERLIRSRDELVQAVSHELGSPLSRLRFHVELLGNLPDNQREERLHAMSRDLDALDELVAELVSYVQSEEIELDRQTFGPRRFLLDLAELARLEAADDREIALELAVPGDVSVYADRRLFQRAVENLLRNAVRHASSRVLLELTRDVGRVRVAVHDDGPGIPEDLRAKVLVPFFRVGADRDRRSGGVGLGLAIVARIMDQHGGEVVVAGSPLGGALIATDWPHEGARLSQVAH